MSSFSRRRPALLTLINRSLPVASLLWIALCSSALASEAHRFDVRAAEPAKLVFWNRPIVELHAQIDDMGPAQRVKRARLNIESALRETPGERASSAPSQLGELQGYSVSIDGRHVFGLVQKDLESGSAETLERAAAQAAEALQGALDGRREQRSLATLGSAVGLTAAATLLLFGVLWTIGRLQTRALRRERLRIPAGLGHASVAVQPFVRTVERIAIKLTGLGLAVIAVYLWLTFVSGRFPYTRPWADELAEFLFDLAARLATDALDALPGLFTVLVIFVLTRILVRGVDGFFRAVEEEALSVSWLEPDTAKATRRLTVALIWIFSLTVAYPYIPGSDSDAFRGIGVLVGLMVSLGSAGLVNQVMSGLVVAYSRALRRGEYVQVGDTEGTVSEVGILSTKVVTPKRETVTVPNAVLVGSAIVNHSRLAEERGAMLGTKLAIGYDTPWRQVHALLALAASRTPGVRRDPKPFVLQRELSSFFPQYELIVHIDRTEQRQRVLSDLHAAIQDVFNEYGVQIVAPNVEVQPESKVWVPKEQWHAAPAIPESETDRTPVAPP